LADQVQHTKNAQALARDWQEVVDIQRSYIDELKATIAALERRLSEAQQGSAVEGG